MACARVGPTWEQLPPDPRLDRRFAEALAAVSDGSFCFPVPFDPVTSALLARHTTSGPQAELTFAARHATTKRRIRIVVCEEYAESGVERTIADCILPIGPASVTLAQIAAELSP
jgi:hypothetical protein